MHHPNPPANKGWHTVVPDVNYNYPQAAINNESDNLVINLNGCTPGASVLCHFIIWYPYSYLLQSEEHTGFNNLHLSAEVVFHSLIWTLQKQTWSDQTSFWFLEWRTEGKVVLFYFVSEGDGSLMQTLKRRFMAFHTPRHCSLDCRKLSDTPALLTVSVHLCFVPAFIYQRNCKQHSTTESKEENHIEGVNRGCVAALQLHWGAN